MSTRITKNTAYLKSNSTVSENKSEKKRSPIDDLETTIYLDSDEFEDIIENTGNRGLNINTEEENNTSVINKNFTDKHVDISIYDYNEDGDSDQHRKQNSQHEITEGDNGRKCGNCQALFENPLDLLRHSRSCQSPRKILPLEDIEKYFDSPNRNYCPICEKRIKTSNYRSVFIKHLLVHTTGLSHECNVCKKKFRRRDHMRAHQRRHIVIAPIYEG